MVSIMKLGSYLFVSLRPDFSDTAWVDFQTTILHEVQKTKSKGIILDLRSVEILDSYGTRLLQTIVTAIKFMGSNSVIVGIQPAIAMTMTKMGLNMKDTYMELNLERAILTLNQLMGENKWIIT